jgi:hypothetical protein
MNTPSTKPPIRWSTTKHSHHDWTSERLFGIHNPAIATAYALTMSYWPHVEEQMIDFLAELMTGRPDREPDSLYCATQIFRARINRNTSIEIMKVLLESTPVNSSKPPLFDEIIKDFCAMNKTRNKYIHGLWWTSENKVLLSQTSKEIESYTKPREIKLTELNDFQSKMRSFFTKVNMRHGKPRGT